MDTVATTRMSSKGQVVIPENVREQLSLKTGARFIVVGEGDVLILKTIAKPAMNQFDKLITRARQQAKIAGMKRSDIIRTIKLVRNRK